MFTKTGAKLVNYEFPQLLQLTRRRTSKIRVSKRTPEVAATIVDSEEKVTLLQATATEKQNWPGQTQNILIQAFKEIKRSEFSALSLRIPMGNSSLKIIHITEMYVDLPDM